MPPYRNDSIKIENRNRLARRITAGVDGRIVYLDRPLALGVKLIIKIEQMTTASPIGLLFGVTSCSVQQIRENDCHVVHMCDTATCGGHCVTLTNINATPMRYL